MHGLDQATMDKLARYLSEMPTLPNESAKTHRFAGLVAELYPGTNITIELYRGTEKRIRIDTREGKKRGRIDTYFGNAILEFEKDLKATENTAHKQLREYAAGVWQQEGQPYRTLLAVATDGIRWQTFLPRITVSQGVPLTPDIVSLDFLNEITVTTDTLREFWFWLTSFLFREGQTRPTAERFKYDFGAASPAYTDALASMTAIWELRANDPEVLLAFDTWRRYLTVTYGKLSDQRLPESRLSDLTTLFLKHTYLASIARLLIWAAMSHGKTTKSLGGTISSVLSGDYFRKQGIENLAEDDFFKWIQAPAASAELAPIWERTLVQMQTYDLERLNQDVLKGVYQQLVDPKDRHDLGEYYTPEWLCEAMVAVTLPAIGYVSVLDPTCGSGSFLRAVIAHLLAANPGGTAAEKLQTILDNVAGIDIHPLAVTIARATYVLAIRHLLKPASQPIQIPVYLADALFLPTEVKQMMLGDVPGYEIRFGKDRRVSVPREMIETPSIFDPAITAATKVAGDHAQTQKETEHSIRSYLERAVPQLKNLPDPEEGYRALWLFARELSDLIRERQNSIWAFVVRNAYRPAMLRGKFDYIIGNPPWLSYRYIEDPEYQREVSKRAIENYGVAPRDQQLRTQMEIASVFLVHALATFGKAGAKLAFVMPRSVLSADQHEPLRSRTYRAPVLIDSYWDLMHVFPVFHVPSCVLFATKGKNPRVAHGSYAMPATEWAGKLPDRDLGWEEAATILTSVKRQGRLIYLGSRNAWSTQKGSKEPTRPSPYAGHFHDGATIYPRNFYCVTGKDFGDGIDPDGTYWVETDPEQAALAKKPYKDVKLEGSIEGQFIFRTAVSRHVLPFLLLDPAYVVLPVIQTKRDLKVLTSKQLRDQGFRDVAAWMDRVEAIWKEKRGAKESHTAIEWLNYQNKLAVQRITDRPIVLYNASGTDLCAAVVDRRKIQPAFVVDHKLYWCECDTQREADYLAAILNTNIVNERIKPFQSTGLQGERDIHKKVLELPFPQFDDANALHLKIAGLGAKARQHAEKVSDDVRHTSLARQRATMRAVLETILAEIDTAVDELI